MELDGIAWYSTNPVAWRVAGESAVKITRDIFIILPPQNLTCALSLFLHTPPSSLDIIA